MRSVFLSMPAIAAAVLLTGAACSAGPAPTALASSGGSPAPGASGAAAGNGAGPGPSVTAAACRTDDVEALVAARPDRTTGDTRMAVVTLTNKSGRTCVVDGWPSISLVNAAGAVVPVPTTEVNEPSAPIRTTLKLGTTAWAGIKWTACDKGADTCSAGNALRFDLKASTDGGVARLEGFPDPESSAITMKNLRIGSIQPLRVDVVAW